MRRTAFLGAAAAAALVGAASAEPREPGQTPKLDSAEAGMWDVMAKAEAEAKRSADLNTDPALNAYVREVTCKVAQAYCPELRVYVMDRPLVNATMAPNGYGEVWSGLLLRAEDEAELAFVLGHEVTHYVENHSIERHTAHKNRQNLVMALSVGVAVGGAVVAANAGPYGDPGAVLDATGSLIDAIYLSSIAAYFRFSRDNENEADIKGVRRASAAGYRGDAAPGSWRDIMAETAASDFDRVRRSDARLGVFDSHPLNADRVQRLEAEAKTLPAAGQSGRDRHRAAIRPHLARWLKDDLRRRDFGQTLYILDRLAVGGEDAGVISFYRGETYRLRRRDGDAALAEAEYAAAAQHPDAPVAVWRELGDLRRKRGDTAGAAQAYAAYLEKAPAAEDAWLVQDALQTLKKASS
jgi:predicted Zn-dependent protease